MAITSQLYVRFTRLNFWLVDLDALYQFLLLIGCHIFLTFLNNYWMSCFVAVDDLAKMASVLEFHHVFRVTQIHCIANLTYVFLTFSF